MTDVYTPPAGSIPARAIAHLQSVGRGVDVRGADLAEAIACDAHNLKNYMATAVKHRIVRSASSGRGKTFYSLSVLDAFDEDEERGGKPSQRLVDAATAPSSAKRGPASVFELGGPTPPPSSWVAPRKAHKAKPKPKATAKRAKPPVLTPVAVREQRSATVHQITPAAPELSCAMFNTGDLVIEAPGAQPLRLSGRQTADLVAYLQRFHNAAGAA